MIVALALFTSIGALATDIYLPSLPVLVSDFSSTTGHVQLTLSVFMFGFAIGQLFYGPLSDRFGRKPVMMSGLVLYTVASVACLFAPSIDELIFYRGVQGFGACAGPVIARAIARDLHSGERAAWLLSSMGTVMGLVPAVAPIIGGYLQLWFGWHSSFIFLAVAGLLAMALLWFRMDESHQHPDTNALRPGHMLRNFSTLLRHRVFLGYVAGGCFAFSGMFAYISGSSFVFQEHFGVGQQVYGFYFALGCMGYMAGTFTGSRLTMRLGISRMIWFGGILAAAAGIVMAALALAQVNHPMAMVGPHMFFLAAAGIVLPQSIAGALTPFPHMAGAASSLFGSAQMISGATAGIFIGHNVSTNQLPLALTVCLCGILTLIAAAFTTQAGRRAPLPQLS